ncbi:biotin--protein ligase-like [Gigantopelta aegis]|uniref:biotin--protein ligase-like n=1 Tax=Gigantopelta aegis TaxID=1735272 RepID=UPI001B8885E3|nr:biotin--protein ligase-like [Gigantopelta aegis]
MVAVTERTFSSNRVLLSAERCQTKFRRNKVLVSPIKWSPQCGQWSHAHYADLSTDECMMGVRRILYVYNGLGVSDVCRDQLFKTLSTLIHPDYHVVEYIKPEEIQCGLWKRNAALITFGGGYDEGFIGALRKEGLKQVQTYVESGGSYLGLCAGGYFGCDRIEFDKHGPLQVCDERHLKFFPGICRGPVFPGFKYRSFKGASAASVTYKPLSGQPVTFSSYYNGGGQFTLYGEGDSDQTVEILAWYNSLPGTPAAIVKSVVGDNGLAILTGIHPEYDSSLLARDDPCIQRFVDTLDKWDAERIDCFTDLLRRLRITVNF